MTSRRKKDLCLYNATNLLIDKLRHSEPLYVTTNFIRSLHHALYHYNRPAAGKHRTLVYGVRIKSDTFTPVPPHQIEARLLNLCEFINNRYTKRTLYKKHIVSKFKEYNSLDRQIQKLTYGLYCASFVHHQITYIHPFSGGNGRLARLMMSMELVNHEIFPAAYPPLLNLVISNHRKMYLDVLGKCDKGDYLSFCVFLMKMLRESIEVEDSLSF